MTDRSWSDVTEDEIRENQRKRCKNCRYAKGMQCGRESTFLVCDYSGMNDKLRGCSPIDCTKFEPMGERKRKRCFYVY